MFEPDNNLNIKQHSQDGGWKEALLDICAASQILVTTHKREEEAWIIHEKISERHKMCFSNLVYFTSCGIKK